MGAVPQNGTATGGMDMLMQFLPLILMFVIFWFLLIRPQQKRAKKHKQMLSELKRGDRVQTSSGLMGRIRKIDDEMVLLECGDAKLRLVRGSIAGLLPDSRGGRVDKSENPVKPEKVSKTEKTDKVELIENVEPAKQDDKVDKASADAAVDTEKDKNTVPVEEKNPQ
jgi:preprotein translocase subunit YajC